jgi:hypothetical protein
MAQPTIPVPQQVTATNCHVQVIQVANEIFVALQISAGGLALTWLLKPEHIPNIVSALQTQAEVAKKTLVKPGMGN